MQHKEGGDVSSHAVPVEHRGPPQPRPPRSARDFADGRSLGGPSVWDAQCLVVVFLCLRRDFGHVPELGQRDGGDKLI